MNTHLWCFYLSVSVDSAAMNLYIHVFEYQFSILLSTYPGVEFPGYIVVLCLYFGGTIKLFFENYILYIYIFNDLIYLFLDRGEGREKEGEKNINVWLPLECPLLGTWPSTQACAPTGN